MSAKMAEDLRGTGSKVRNEKTSGSMQDSAFLLQTPRISATAVLLPRLRPDREDFTRWRTCVCATDSVFRNSGSA